MQDATLTSLLAGDRMVRLLKPLLQVKIIILDELMTDLKRGFFLS
jgi:hypothetical protein